MKKIKRVSLDEMIQAKYGIRPINKREFIMLKATMLSICENVKPLGLRGTIELLDKAIKIISEVTNVKEEILDCLTIQNIEDMFNQVECYSDLQKTLIDLIRLYNASKKVNASRAYSLMSTSRWLEEYNYWIFQDDKESMDHINSYKSIREYGIFKYTCHIEIEL